MKRWLITNDDIEYDCSLLSLVGASKIATFANGKNRIHFQFMKFFDYSKAKVGVKQTGWVRLPHTNNQKVRAQIIFKYNDL